MEIIYRIAHAAGLGCIGIVFSLFFCAVIWGINGEKPNKSDRKSIIKVSKFIGFIVFLISL